MHAAVARKDGGRHEQHSGSHRHATRVGQEWRRHRRLGYGVPDTATMIVAALHAFTPTLTAVDPRGLEERCVAYYRDDAAQPVETRVERHAHDAVARLSAQWDARLWADGGEDGEPNQSTRWSLSGRPLRAMSVDAGWRMVLFDVAGQVREGWDGRGTHHWRTYDTQQRPLSVHEHPADQPARCVERWSHGGPPEATTNGCGQLIRHDDPAGTREMTAHGLSGGPLVCTQRFLSDLSTPDWPVALEERDALLETHPEGTAPGYVTHWRYDAWGAAWRHADAAGHTRHHAVDVAGQPIRVAFQAAGAPSPTSVIEAVDYDASGRATSETAGNGVTTRTTWSTVDGRLQQRQVLRATRRLQDADYLFDPVGNLMRSEDRAQPTAWFDGAQVDTLSVYRYDTLYQLVEATGCESVQAMIGPALPGIVLPGGGNGSQRRNYTRAYRYDASGNLLTLSHTASDGTRYTRAMAVAERSNRSLYQSSDAPPDFTAGFDVHGNQQALEGQLMTWDARDRLQHVTQVLRAGGTSDGETYVYGGDGTRRRKVRTTQGGAVAHIHEVRYLPDLEVHRNNATGEAWEVASIQAGRSPVRWLHGASSGRGTGFHRQPRLPPGDSAWRYTVDDHLGSATLELDDAGDVISHEGYYPYGGTAWWAARSELEANDKTMRYSGKERDATGLYYYGYRYYAPWLCRWINPDPAGDIDGLNRYRMVGDNPSTHVDANGLAGEMNSHWAAWEDIHGDTADARPGALWDDEEAMRGPPHGFFDPFLEQRLADRDQATGGAAAVVADFSHMTAASRLNVETFGDDKVSSSLLDSFPNIETFGDDDVSLSLVDASANLDALTMDSVSTEEFDQFTNRYARDEWTFKVNIKYSESRRYFANDVARHQYRRIATENGFFGVLPPVIRRQNVINRTTLHRTANLPDDSKALRRTFLEKTPNGKTTQRILDDFGLHATAVQRLQTRNDEADKTDFLVRVRPALGRPPGVRHHPYQGPP